MELKTERLSLRLAEEHDVEAMTEALNDYDVVKMLQVVPYPYDREMARTFVSLVHSEWEKNSSFIAVAEANGKLAGLVGAHHWSAENGSIELGYWLARDAWGHGYATEAARAICAFAFDHWPIYKIVSSVFNDNPASKRVVEKLGFKEAGPHTIYSVSRGAEVEATMYELPRP